MNNILFYKKIIEINLFDIGYGGMLYLMWLEFISFSMSTDV